MAAIQAWFRSLMDFIYNDRHHSGAFVLLDYFSHHFSYLECLICVWAGECSGNPPRGSCDPNPGTGIPSLAQWATRHRKNFSPGVNSSLGAIAPARRIRQQEEAPLGFLWFESSAVVACLSGLRTDPSVPDSHNDDHCCRLAAHRFRLRESSGCRGCRHLRSAPARANVHGLDKRPERVWS